VLDPNQNSFARSLVVSGSDVYIAGDSRNSSIIHVPGYWKNGIWTSLPALDDSKSSGVFSIFVSGDIYAGGVSRDSSGAEVPGYWNNGTWISLPAIDGTQGAQVRSLAVSGTDVYCAGFSAGETVPGYWKNGIWSSVIGVDPTKNSLLPHLLSLEAMPIWAAIVPTVQTKRWSDIGKTALGMEWQQLKNQA